MRSHGKSGVLLSLLAITFLISVSLKLVSLPISRAIEQRYCLEYFIKHDPSLIRDDGQVPEQECKVGPVQQQVGFMVGALETVSMACDILSAAPLAYLADSIGHRRVLSLNVAAMLLRLAIIIAVVGLSGVPLYAMLVAPVVSMFGGSTSLNTSLCLALVTSVAEHEAERSTYISWLYSLPFIAGMLGPSIAAATMTRSVSIPLMLAFLLNALAWAVSAALRQNAVPSLKRRSSGDTAESSSLLERADAGPDEASLQSVLSGLLSRASLSSMYAGYASIARTKSNFRVLLLAFFFTGAASASSFLLPLLLSNRFGWTFAQIGVIFSFKAIINLTMSVVLVPAYSSWTRARSKTAASASTSDLVGGHTTLIISAFGAICIALAAGKVAAILALCIYAAGSVAGTFMYALARSSDLDMLGEQETSRGFALIVLVHSIGGLVWNPIMTGIWTCSLSTGAWLGMPFMISAILYAAASAALANLR